MIPGLRDISKSTVLIPYELFGWVTKNRFHKPFRLYLHLKHLSDGRIKINDAKLQDIAKELGCCSKTVRNNLKVLQSNNWIGYDARTRYYFVRGFDRIKSMYGFDRMLYVEFAYKWIKYTKVFTESTLVAYLVNVQIRKDRRNRRGTVEYNNVSNVTRSQPAISVFKKRPVSCIAISKCFGVSKSKSHAIKKRGGELIGKDSSFLIVEKNYEAIAGVRVKEINTFRESNPEIAHKVKVINKQVVIVRPDLVSHNIRFVMRKNTYQ